MIELISPSRCTGCNICVEVCPTRVFDAVPGGQPVLARQHDCQTCFMCELYCPTDALYVAPIADESVVVSEAILAERGLLGSYRRALGWQPGQDSTAGQDASHELLARVR
jgi:NAD-dependent dihydropyrimidine dehydrogenase PreA subunit